MKKFVTFLVIFLILCVSASAYDRIFAICVENNDTALTIYYSHDEDEWRYIIGADFVVIENEEFITLLNKIKDLYYEGSDKFKYEVEKLKKSIYVLEIFMKYKGEKFETNHNLLEKRLKRSS